MNKKWLSHVIDQKSKIDPLLKEENRESRNESDGLILNLHTMWLLWTTCIPAEMSLMDHVNFVACIIGKWGNW